MIRYGDVRKLRWQGRESARWYVRVYHYDSTGRPSGKSWKCTGMKDRDLAQAQVNAWQFRELQPPAQAPVEKCFPEGVDEWVSERTVGRSRNYCKLLRLLARQWKDYWPRKTIVGLSETEVSAYVRASWERGEIASTINMHVRILRSFFAWAIKHEYAQKQPCPSKAPLPCPPRAIRVLSPEETERLLHAAAEHSERAYGSVLCLLQTGFRSHLADTVRWEHVDLETGFWHIPAIMLKSRNEYHQPVAPKLLAWLRAHAQDSGQIFGWYMQKIWGKVRAAAGLLDVRRHDLRKTFVTRCQQHGVPIRVTMALSDHRDVPTMVKFYCAVSSDDTREALRATFGD